MAMFIGAICQARMTADKLVQGFVDVFSEVKLARLILRLKHSKLMNLLIFNFTDFSTNWFPLIEIEVVSAMVTILWKP